MLQSMVLQKSDMTGSLKSSNSNTCSEEWQAVERKGGARPDLWGQNLDLEQPFTW